jgi:DnaJ-class molecular chaperone
VWWVVDVARRPRRRCPRCHGSGKVRVRGNRYDNCPWCDGGKKPPKLRLGARWVRPGLKKGK